MALETVDIVLDQTWRLISNAGAGSFRAVVKEGVDALFSIGTVAPEAESLLGMPERSISFDALDGKVWARGAGIRSVLSVTRVVDAGNPAPIVLDAPTLSASTFSTAIPANGEVAVAGSNVLGAKIVIKFPDDGRFKISPDGTRLRRGTLPVTPDVPIGIAVEVSHPLAPNSPRSKTFQLTPFLAALPALPMAAGAKMVALGDSLVAYSNNAGTPVSTSEKIVGSFAYGFLDHLRSIDQRVVFDTWFDASAPNGQNMAGANQGIFGDHMEWTHTNIAYVGGGIAPRLPAILARNPQIVLLEGGSNTINSNDNDKAGTAAYITGHFEQMLRRCREAGVYAILTVIFPRADWPAGDARYQVLRDVNVWIRAQAGRPGLLGILDPWADLAPADVLDPLMFMGDKVHIGQRGGWMVAKKHLLPILQTAVAPGSYFDTDATANNLMVPALAKLQGTAGGKSGGATGNVASNLLVNSVRNLSACVASKEVVSGDMEAQVLDLTPADLAAPAFWQAGIAFTVVSLPNPALGKWYRLALKMETVGPASVSTIRANVSLRSNANVVLANTVFQSGFSPDFGVSIADGNRVWWLVSNPIMAPDGGLSERFLVGLDLYGDKLSGPIKFKLSSPILREIPDPRPAWGY
ncbi:MULTISPECIES: SGNH/GDSL hydrolase family protein [unclassified Aureimonas]|uniref:SGNH/GDSL hydrolase family protein n=1 Tax=unclassified Aureimonas TaxID=2615206 RepID=UPI0007019480|nr:MULTISPECIES: SGNH/GDSL hydrolase family protein [unclassified Aureimonas]KQT52276.1 hypothetical protein ASG62_16605 [Aureimonas sp. Leaf427]KQT73250.1 hypothetical protein ASG54_17880 [Aureimonas sp. Leaf460]